MDHGNPSETLSYFACIELVQIFQEWKNLIRLFIFCPDNLFHYYLKEGEVTPGVVGDSARGEIVADMTTSFVALCAIYFPSVTGKAYSCLNLFSCELL